MVKEDNVDSLSFKSDISIVQRIGSGTTPTLNSPKSTSEMAPLEEGKLLVL